MFLRFPQAFDNDTTAYVLKMTQNDDNHADQADDDADDDHHHLDAHDDHNDLDADDREKYLEWSRNKIGERSTMHVRVKQCLAKRYSACTTSLMKRADRWITQRRQHENHR